MGRCLQPLPIVSLITPGYVQVPDFYFDILESMPVFTLDFTQDMYEYTSVLASSVYSAPGHMVDATDFICGT